MVGFTSISIKLNRFLYILLSKSESVYYSLMQCYTYNWSLMSIHYFSAILIKKDVVSLIKISVLLLKDNAYFTDWYSYKYSTEIGEISLILI